jgi:hypothetical protein
MTNCNRPQDQPVEVALDELEAKLNQLICHLLDLYHEAQADGAFGLPPKHPEVPIYWQGYCKGLHTYWMTEHYGYCAGEF